MGLTTALNTSLNGLALNETTIDVIGNNIANAGTTGFKASRVLFSTQLSRTLSFGSKPTDTSGGTNPRQIGLGALTATIIPDFTPGSISASTSPSDLAIQGDGFFIVNSSDGQVYTRNGNFRLDSSDKLSTSQGNRVLGYTVDSDFNLITTGLSEISIPLGSLHLAQQSSKLTLGGALSPQGALATRGTLQTSNVLVDSTNTPIASAAALLTTVRNQGAPATPLYTAGDVLKFTPQKGGRQVEAKSLTVTATTTVQDLMTFFDNTLGLQGPPQFTAVPTDADGIDVGATLVGGAIQIKGNRGIVNDFDIAVGTLTNNGSVIPLSFSPNANRADGESTVTTFTLYDSLGTPLTVRMSAVMETQSSNNTTFRYFLESADQAGADVVIGNSTVTFDNVGRVTAQPSNQFSLSRTGTAAVDPMLFSVDLSQISGISATGSNLNLTNQDGTSPGTLTSYVIDEQGNINGAFDNGIIRSLGQVVLARFTNPAGLLQNGYDNFREGISSGLPQIAPPGEFGTGTIRSGSIELSNTDIGRNLVDLIVASTNYRGNARVISSVDQLVNELLALGR